MSAAALLSRTRAAALGLTMLLVASGTASAQEDVALFLGGAATALGLHESGHLVFDAAFGASPGIRKVSFGPLPFFAITHDPLSPVRELTVSSAGFWVQHLSDEIILTRMSEVRRRHAPFVKGMLAFNVLTSVGYAAAAFARSGPAERDTRGIAVSVDIGEPLVGAFVLAPALADAARYYAPDRRWLKWTSRTLKAAGMGLLIAAHVRD